MPKTEELKKEYFEVFLPELRGSDWKGQPVASNGNDDEKVAESTAKGEEEKVEDSKQQEVDLEQLD